VKNLEVRADSELLIKQLRGEYRVKNEGLKPLFTEAKRWLARFGSVRLVHVRRESNVEADRLANRSIDEQRAAASAERASDRIAAPTQSATTASKSRER
jgi:ribonuclease HI